MLTYVEIVTNSARCLFCEGTGIATYLDMEVLLDKGFMEPADDVFDRAKKRGVCPCIKFNKN